MRKKKTLRNLMLATSMMLYCSISAYAGFNGIQDIGNVGDILKTGSKYVCDVVMIGSSIAIAIEVLPAVIKGSRSNNEAKETLSQLAIAVIYVFVIVGLIRAVLQFL